MEVTSDMSRRFTSEYMGPERAVVTIISAFMVQFQTFEDPIQRSK
jgi:hypothetical protein